MTEERIVDCVIIERTFEKAGDAKAQWLTIKAMCEPAPPKLDRDEIITLKGCLYYLLNDLESRDEDGYIRPNCIAGNKVLEKMIQWLVTIEGQIVKEE